YAPACAACRLRPICGGLFDRGAAYDPAELAPQFYDPEPIVRAILEDPSDPTVSDRTLSSWREEFRRHGLARTAVVAGGDAPPRPAAAPPVGQITAEGVRPYPARRPAPARKADALGGRQEPGRGHGPDPHPR